MFKSSLWLQGREGGAHLELDIRRGFSKTLAVRVRKKLRKCHPLEIDQRGN